MDKNSEIKEKERRVREFLEKKGLDGMLLCRQDNFSWFTAGKANSVVMGADIGFTPILVTPTKKYIITNNIEAPRIMEEEVQNQGFELVTLAWYHFDNEFLNRVKNLAEGRVGSDAPFPGLELVGRDFSELRYTLTPEEIQRYRWLGRESTKAMEESCREIIVGQSEFQIGACLAKKLFDRGIIPSVLLVGTDERIFNYRHPVPTEKKLQKYAMIVVVAVKGGLNVALTRLVHFGPPPQEIVEKHKAVVNVDATLITSTVPGKSYSEIFDKGARAYAQAGYPDEWKKHFQGGPIGYGPREFNATFETHQEVLVNQAVAWNPTITGVKSEDTFIIGEKGREIITTTDNWPVVEVKVEGQVIQRPDILKREQP